MPRSDDQYDLVHTYSQAKAGKSKTTAPAVKELGRENAAVQLYIGKEIAPAALRTPPSGVHFLFFDQTGSLRAKDSSGSLTTFTGGAPTDTSYVTINSDSDLSAERTLNATGNLTQTDNGANSAVDLDTVDNPTFTDLTATTATADTVDADTTENDDYHEGVTTQSGSTGDLDLSASNLIKQTVTGDITFSFNNASSSPAGNSFLLIVEQDSTGGHSLSWPSAVEWDGGSAPGVSTNANDTHVFSFVSSDGGTTWYGFVAGEAMA